MQLSAKILSACLSLSVLMPALATEALSAPTRYVTNWTQAPAKKRAVKRPAKKASKASHANYQRRVPSYNPVRSGGGGDYLAQVGGNSRWAPGKTIRVYVAPGKASGKNMVASAMNKWAKATGNAFRWTLVGNPSQADYSIVWHTNQRQVSTGTEAGLTTTETMVDPYSGREIIDRARTKILTRYNGRALSDAEIAETTLHEIGHALGLEGHSSNPRDIMYYAATKNQGGLTARDINTISRLYR